MLNPRTFDDGSPCPSGYGLLCNETRTFLPKSAPVSLWAARNEMAWAHRMGNDKRLAYWSAMVAHLEALRGAK